MPVLWAELPVLSGRGHPFDLRAMPGNLPGGVEGAERELRPTAGRAQREGGILLLLRTESVRGRPTHCRAWRRDLLGLRRRHPRLTLILATVHRTVGPARSRRWSAAAAGIDRRPA